MWSIKIYLKTNKLLKKIQLYLHIMSLTDGIVLDGMKSFSVLQMSEPKACVFEKMVPFRLLKRVTCVHFVPASAGERRKILHTM